MEPRLEDLEPVWQSQENKGEVNMDDVYQINAAKTEFREAYRTGDAELLLSLFHPTKLMDMSEGQPTRSGETAKAALRESAAELFSQYRVQLDVIIIDIVVLGDTAYDYGWHEFTLTPKRGGAAIRRRERYYELWRKDSSDAWKISFFVNNADVPERLGGSVSHWFKGQDSALFEATA